MESLEYLGHIVLKDGVRVDPAKIQAIVDCPAPTGIKELQMFLGMCNYYARFINNIADISAPLYKLLQKETPWEWGQL